LPESTADRSAVLHSSRGKARDECLSVAARASAAARERVHHVRARAQPDHGVAELRDGEQPEQPSAPVRELDRREPLGVGGGDRLGGRECLRRAIYEQLWSSTAWPAGLIRSGLAFRVRPKGFEPLTS
jgi:hypothetical protein